MWDKARTLEVDQHPDYWVRVGEARGAPTCFVCGRKCGKKNYYVLCLDGHVICHPDDAHMFDWDFDLIGMMRIGSECRKKLGKFVFESKKG